MSSSMNYNERRLIHGLTNLIQKIPKLSLKDNSNFSESEIWNTYFNSLLSCLICDPEKLVHLRWTSATPSEDGKLRPDAAVNDVFWRLCKKADGTVTINNRYKETVDLEGLIGAGQDCARTCAMRYGQ